MCDSRQPANGADSVPLLVQAPTPLGGIVPCSVKECEGKVITFRLYRTSIGVELLTVGRYFCGAHGLGDL